MFPITTRARVILARKQFAWQSRGASLSGGGVPIQLRQSCSRLLYNYSLAGLWPNFVQPALKHVEGARSFFPKTCFLCVKRVIWMLYQITRLSQSSITYVPTKMHGSLIWSGFLIYFICITKSTAQIKIPKQSIKRWSKLIIPIFIWQIWKFPVGNKLNCNLHIKISYFILI